MTLVARDYLSTPAVSVSVEREFNSGRDIIIIQHINNN